jgi:UDP-N-acetylmuramoyl-tripeptide--D-alanyl-D-alanine ligase
VGSLGRIIAEESLAGGMPPDRVIILPDVEAAKEALPAVIHKGDVVLIKASRGVRLDQLVDFLTQESAGTGPAAGESA